jgi:caffeoyl-CoA O-methyltransferase
MKKNLWSGVMYLMVAAILILSPKGIMAQPDSISTDLDKKVEQFLEKHKYKWHDMNIPTEDGKFLYNLVVKNNYKNAVEIGTSTGHSAIWIAWALSKTGGKLITIEINESRFQKALENFKEAGLENYIDARLDDAHKLVPKLKAPIDFVFCDADKGWYKNYFKDTEHKLVAGGCFAAHNVTDNVDVEPSVKDYLKFVDELPNFKTNIVNESSSGISVSIKTRQR